MSDFLAALMIAIGVCVFIAGICFISAMFCDFRLVNDAWLVEQGYALFVPDTTNGTIRFEWIDLAKVE